MARRLTLNDGTVLENCTANLFEGCLTCFIEPEMPLKEVADLFLDPDKTESIRMELGDNDETFRGYTKVRFILANQEISIGLRRPDGWSETEAGGN